MSNSYRARLETLLRSSVNVAYDRRRQRFLAVRSLLERPVVIWGTGALGEYIAGALDELGIGVEAFVDRDQTRRQSPFRGVGVISPDELRDGAFADRLVIIGVYTSAPLLALLAEWKRPHLSFPELAWGFPEFFLPYCALDDPEVARQDEAAVLAALEHWSDDASRREYLGQLEWRFSLDYAALPPHLPAPETYFPARWVALRDDEHYVDCGAYDGDSVRTFLALTSERFRRVTALEADATTFERLTTYVHTLPAPIQAKVSPINMAVGAAAGFASFNADGSVRSSVGSGTAEVEVTTLDAISARAPITFVKMDIEGAEPLAVAGGRRAIRDDRPILAVCLYHAFDHLWTIPNALAAIAGDYDFFLGRHSDECWELVCYAVPRGRRVGA